MIEPRLTRICIFPIKSLDAVEVESAAIAPHGKLGFDRSFALFEGQGDIIKAKSNSEIHQLHARVDIESSQATFRLHKNPESHRFHLENERVEIGDWLSQAFGRPVKLQRDDTLGFADDWTATGPTLVSTATLEAIASWFEELTVEDIRARLRTNLEIDGVPAFWEDQLYGPNDGDLIPFRIGKVELLGKNSCQRCPVPTRDAESGEPTPRFAKIFATQRKATLQPWAHPERFDHFYRAAINTKPGKIPNDAYLKIGDALQITQPAN